MFLVKNWLPLILNVDYLLVVSSSCWNKIIQAFQVYKSFEKIDLLNMIKKNLETKKKLIYSRLNIRASQKEKYS